MISRKFSETLKLGGDFTKVLIFSTKFLTFQNSRKSRSFKVYRICHVMSKKFSENFWDFEISEIFWDFQISQNFWDFEISENCWDFQISENFWDFQFFLGFEVFSRNKK